MAVVLHAEERALRPRSIRKQLRAAGRVPGVVYGNKMENTAISVDGPALSKALRENGVNAVYYVELNGEKIPTLLHRTQTDTFTNEWVHAEFLAVDMSEEQEVEAEIVLVGMPVGVKEGGVLTQTLYTATVSATPDKLPESIEVNVEDLAIGSAISVADIPKHADYTIITDPEEQVASVVEMAVEEEPSEEEVVAEPEVITEKEQEE